MMKLITPCTRLLWPLSLACCAAAAHAQWTVERIPNLGRFMEASSLNNQGQVVGTDIVGASERHAFIYGNGTLRDLTPLLGVNARVNHINDQGLFTGATHSAA
jgi:probable HAF family extracellular repeat protein